MRLLDELPRLTTLTPEEIEARLTAGEVADILGRPNVVSREHDSVRVQYLDGDEFLITVERVFGGDLPELDGRSRDEVYLTRRESYANSYRVGLGDTAVELVDYEMSDRDVIDLLATALRQ